MCLAIILPEWSSRGWESCLCLELLHNLVSNLAERRHQPSAHFVELADLHHVSMRPEPLPTTETRAVPQVLEPVDEARIGAIPPIEFIPRAGPDCLAIPCSQEFAKHQCRASESRGGPF
jgi:hypothetical protein